MAEAGDGSETDGHDLPAFRLFLSCPTCFSPSQVFVVFDQSYDRIPHLDTSLENSISETINSEQIRFHIATEHLYYVKSVMGRPGSTDPGYPGKKFEIVAFTDCNEDSNQAFAVHTIADHINTPSASAKGCEITDMTTSTPTTKRALFQGATSPNTKKKAHSKVD